MTKCLSSEYLSDLEDRYAFVSRAVEFAIRRQAYLARQGEITFLHEAISQLKIEKAKLGIEIGTLNEFLTE